MVACNKECFELHQITAYHTTKKFCSQNWRQGMKLAVTVPFIRTTSFCIILWCLLFISINALWNLPVKILQVEKIYTWLDKGKGVSGGVAQGSKFQGRKTNNLNKKFTLTDVMKFKEIRQTRRNSINVLFLKVYNFW